MRNSVVILCFVCFLAFVPNNRVGADEEVPLLWTSGAGGWRALTVAMGYATLFSKADLITPGLCAFSGISTASGSSWFSSQFFFSQAFFDRVVVNDPEDLYDFVIEWMDAYRPVSRLLRNSRTKDVDESLQAAFLFRNRGITAAQFFTNMLLTTSTAYGDPDFVRCEASPENLVSAFHNTSLYIQISLAPVSRVPGLVGGGTNVYLGAGNSSSSQQIYNTLLGFQFAVESSGSSFKASVEQESLPFKMYTKRAKRSFSFKDWENYPMYNGPDTEGTIFSEDDSLRATDMTMSVPFRGKPTGVQVAVASSQSTSNLDSLSPATFAQFFSLDRFEISSSDVWFGRRARQLSRLRFLTNILYRSAGRLSAGVCSQFPNECGQEDVQLGDGGFTDFYALAMHLGRHRGVPKVKVILTKTESVINTLTFTLAYFNTTFNQGVAPGDFIWYPPTNSVSGALASVCPTRSIQLFSEYLDGDLLATMLTPISDANVSWARLNLTTVDNPAVGVAAGQEVDMLLLSLDNNTIPASILGFDQVDAWTVPMAEAARDIAASEGLLSVVQEFVAS